MFRNEKLGLTGPGSMAPGTQHTVVYMNQPQVGIPPQPYQNQRQYMQQTTTYVQQPAAFSQSQFPAYPQQTSAYPQENPPLYAQQAHIQAETQVTTSTINQKTDL